MKKDFLGGMFKHPNFKDIKNILKGKLGYMPRENIMEYPNSYRPNPIIDLPFIVPTVYFLLRRNF